MMDFTKEWYRGKKVLVTGATGFKGSWLCKLLLLWGAQVTGYALEPPTKPALYDLIRDDERLELVIADIRDFDRLFSVFQEIQPEVVFHLAAQPIVREGYRNPRDTYEINVMGTVNVLECVRRTPSVRSVINVTTDKVYRNREEDRGFVEENELNGQDPYSNSKSCSELVTSCYCASYLQEAGIPVSTLRAGNVIGGGDFAADRIVPDCYRALRAGERIVVRNPAAIRPFQHVLEPVRVYLELAMLQTVHPEVAGSYNIGPEETDFYTVGDLADSLCRSWKNYSGQPAEWISRGDRGPREAGILKLNCDKIRRVLGWKPRWNLETALDRTCEWYLAYIDDEKSDACMVRQIKEFYEEDES